MWHRTRSTSVPVGTAKTQTCEAMGTVLVVDDELDTRSLVEDALRKRGFEVEGVASADECLQRLQARSFDVVVTDVIMAGMTGIELCATLREQHPEVLSIVVTGFGALDTAIEAMRAGAYDFIVKPVRIDALIIAASRAMEHLSLQREVKRLRSAAFQDFALQGIIGSSAALRETTELVNRVASSDATVLITGESGTGKELVAKALHALSPRSAQPFVAVNCAAMPAPLLESELFGHVRGAFTDAKSSRQGLFVQARGGTIFLDEIGEMPIEMQAKLLRVLQERKVRPVGDDTEVPFEARVIAATNRCLETEIEAKRFREDLFYRINVVAIPVPPLRERADDILTLAQSFLKRCAARTGKAVEGISGPAARMLLNYDWPGNVRELENCMERAVALCRFNELNVDDLPAKVQEHGDSTTVIAVDSPQELITIAEMERRYVRRVLEAVGGNKTHAARLLGIDRRSLYRRLEQPRPEQTAPIEATESAGP
jgi:two-component system response regulator AtoC